ncbi:MAG: DUF1365 domain-containing protein [Rhodobacteraceae bacterium]|nr:DUF1365 domain-containing protein [Paracoccaceae bacterium]
MDLAEAGLLRARVFHRRTVPVVNQFTYGLDYLLLDEALLEGRRGPRLFSYDRANLVCLFRRDHGMRGCQGVDGVRQFAIDAGISGVRSVLFLSHPRYWGYTFNPVSFWFLLGSRGNLRGVLAEVHNTYGERHGYLCRGDADTDIEPDTPIRARKCFHVSPFFDVCGAYTFTFQLTPERVAVRIIYDDGKGGGLITSLVGARHPLTDWTLLQALGRRPLGALRTSALIHWQALRLWSRGVRFRKRPALPDEGIT